MNTRSIVARYATRLRYCCLMSSCSAIVGWSQTVSTPSPAAGTSGTEEVVVLSPFEVRAEQDNGYQAASTVSATALATPLKESSAVVGVLTKEFLEDIAATSLEDAASWAPNTYIYDAAEKNDEQLSNYSTWTVMRGVNALSNQARDYFLTNAPLDTATIDRFEQPRGPNAALFGAAPQVGMINVNSKKALLQRNFNRLGIRADDNGGVRATVDSNVGNRKFAFRLNAMKEKVEGWRDADVQRNKLLMLSGTWRIDDATTFRAEIMWDQRGASFPPPNLYENVAKWDGATVFSGPRTTNPAATTGTARIAGANDYLLFDSTDEYAMLNNWKNLGRTTGNNLVAYPDAVLAGELRPGLTSTPVLPSREFTFNPSTPPMSEKSTRLYSAILEHMFLGKLAAQLAFNKTETDLTKWMFSFSNVYRDINTVRPDGTANPHFGELYTDNPYRRDFNTTDSQDVRMLLSYPFKWGFMQQTLSLMGGIRWANSYIDRLVLVRENGSDRLVNSTANYVYFRRYESERNDPLPVLGPGTYGGYQIGMHPWNYVYTDTDTKYWQAALAGRYWDGKVTTTFGLRRDMVTQTTLIRDSNTTLDDTDHWSHFHWGDPYDTTPQSLTGGIVSFPVQWLGVFANYAEGYNIQGVRPNLYGDLWDAPKYKGIDFGLKLELFDGRISGTISRYTSKRTGVDPGTASPQNNFGQLWIDTINGYTSLAATATAGGNTTLAAQYTAQAAAAQTEKDKIVGTAYDSRDLEANGWEVDLTANITRNWRAVFNLGLPETKQTNASPISKAYYEAHRAEWQSHLNDSANFNTTDITNQINAIENAFLSQGNGAATLGTPDYSANLFTNYRISSGRLKGLRFGGGVQLQGPRIIGVPVVFTPTSATTGTFAPPDQLATIKSQKTSLVTAMIGYDFKLARRQVRLQLNVSNLLDEDKLVYTNVATYIVPGTTQASGYQVPNRFRFINPRTFTLSCNIDL